MLDVGGMLMRNCHYTTIGISVLRGVCYRCDGNFVTRTVFGYYEVSERYDRFIVLSQWSLACWDWIWWYIGNEDGFWMWGCDDRSRINFRHNTTESEWLVGVNYKYDGHFVTKTVFGCWLWGLLYMWWQFWNFFFGYYEVWVRWMWTFCCITTVVSSLLRLNCRCDGKS